MCNERQRGNDAERAVCLERRASLRLGEPFPALVRWRQGDGRTFEEEVALDDLSATGLHMRLAHMPAIGTTLFVIVRLELGAEIRTPGPGVAILGAVLRTTPMPNGRCGVAVVFIRHRLLFAA